MSKSRLLCAVFLILAAAGAPSAWAIFDPPELITALGSPELVAMGEFSGDSFPDLVAGSADNSRLALYFGRGDLTFVFPVSVIVGGRPVAGAVADIDQNGLDDILWVDGDTGVFGVVYQINPTTRTFTTARHSGADEAHDVVAIDVDGDTWIDGVVTHRGADTVTVYRNLAGSFLPGEEWGVGDGPSAMAARTWSGGFSRLAVVQAGVLSDNVGIYDERLTPRQILPLPSPAHVAHLDWDADPWPDLLIARRDGHMHVYSGNAAGTFGPEVSWAVQNGATQAEILSEQPGVAHRVAVLETARQRLAVYPLDPSGLSGAPYGSFLGPGVDRFVLGDADLDGRKELYAPLTAEDRILMIEERDDDTWTGFPTVLSGRLPVQLERVDASGGLPMRLGALCLTDRELWIYERTNKTLTVSAVVPLASNASRFRWAKIDGDDEPDLVVMGSSSGVEIFLADGAGFQGPLRLDITGNLQDLVALRHAGGSETDLVIADKNVAGLRIFSGDGLGGFTETDFFECSDTPIRLHAADLDLDQRLDVVALGDVNKICLVYNDVTGFDSFSVFQVGNQPRGVDVGILVEDDALPDIVVGNAGENTFSVLTSIFPRIYAQTVQNQLTPSGAQVALQADLGLRGVNDLLFASPSSLSVALHQNAGAGVFVIPQQWRASSLPLDMETMDVDENGWPDVVLLNGLGDSLVILLNRRDLTEPSPGPPVVAPPTQTSIWMEPPYPNPSTGNVSVRARSDDPRVDLAIFDLRGRLVRRLEATPDAGFHTATWTGVDARGRAVARGRYMVRLRAAGQEVSRSIILH